MPEGPPWEEEDECKAEKEEDQDTCCESEECEECECEHDTECVMLYKKNVIGEFKGIHLIGLCALVLWIHVVRIFFLSIFMLITKKTTTYFFRIRLEPVMVMDFGFEDNNRPVLN